MVNVREKRDVLKICGDAEKEKVESNVEKIISKIEKNDIAADKEEKNSIIRTLEYEYKYKNAIIIPTKTSVTEIKKGKCAL